MECSHIPHNFEVVVHLAAAARHIADISYLPWPSQAPPASAFFSNMDMLALHLAVAQIAGSGQRSQTGADDISGYDAPSGF